MPSRLVMKLLWIAPLVSIFCLPGCAGHRAPDAKSIVAGALYAPGTARLTGFDYMGNLKLAVARDDGG